MMILDEFGFRRAHGFALEQAIAIQAVSGDLRWALAVLAARSLLAVCRSGLARFVVLVRNAGRRVRRKARYMTRLTAADTMVAAGGR
jgi:hypothetical protein